MVVAGGSVLVLVLVLVDVDTVVEAVVDVVVDALVVRVEVGDVVTVVVGNVVVDIAIVATGRFTVRAVRVLGTVTAVCQSRRVGGLDTVELETVEEVLVW